VKSQQLFFCVSQHNFGVVQVDFSTPDRPRVSFEVCGENEELLGKIEPDNGTS
jgi:hypothetical protein